MTNLIIQKHPSKDEFPAAPLFPTNNLSLRTSRLSKRDIRQFQQRNLPNLHVRLGTRPATALVPLYDELVPLTLLVLLGEREPLGGHDGRVLTGETANAAVLTRQRGGQVSVAHGAALAGF